MLTVRLPRRTYTGPRASSRDEPSSAAASTRKGSGEYEYLVVIKNSVLAKRVFAEGSEELPATSRGDLTGPIGRGAPRIRRRGRGLAKIAQRLREGARQEAFVLKARGPRWSNQVLQPDADRQRWQSFPPGTQLRGRSWSGCFMEAPMAQLARLMNAPAAQLAREIEARTHRMRSKEEAAELPSGG